MKFEFVWRFLNKVVGATIYRVVQKTAPLKLVAELSRELCQISYFRGAVLFGLHSVCSMLVKCLRRWNCNVR